MRLRCATPQARGARTHERPTSPAGGVARLVFAAAVLLLFFALVATGAYADPFLTTKPVAHDPWPLSGKPHIPSVDRVAPPGPSLGSTLAAEVAGSTVRTAGDIAFSETFEANMSAWTLSGSPTWARTDFTAGAGTWSAYCAGSTISPPGPYANNMNAWMVAGPFDLTTYTLPRLEYSMWLNSELGYDKIQILVSTDGANFTPDVWTGPLGGWFANVPMDLTCVPTLGNLAGQSKVWIAFRFVSDATNTATGTFIDEVRLSDAAKRPACVWLDSVTPAVVGYNKPVTIAGALTNTWVSAGLPGKTVNVYTKTDVSDWTLVGTLPTNGTGDYAGTLPIVRRTWFAVAFPGDTEFESAYSDTMFGAPFATSHASLTPPAMPRICKPGVLYKRWGTLKPIHTAEQNKTSHTKVFFYHLSHGKWRLINSGYAKAYRNTTSATQYMVRWSFGISGRWRVRARHRDADHATTYSAWRYFRVP